MTNKHITQHINQGEQPNNDMASPGSDEQLCVLRPPAEALSRQGLPFFVGVSGNTSGAVGLAMNLVVIPPGGSAVPHLHDGYESAIYHLQGRVKVRFGPGLRKSVICEPGDFLFIGPNVLHQPINLSETEPVVAIVARNDPHEQEHVIVYEPEAELVDAFA